MVTGTTERLVQYLYDRSARDYMQVEIMARPTAYARGPVLPSESRGEPPEHATMVAEASTSVNDV